MRAGEALVLAVLVSFARADTDPNDPYGTELQDALEEAEASGQLPPPSDPADEASCAKVGSGPGAHSDDYAETDPNTGEITVDVEKILRDFPGAATNPTALSGLLESILVHEYQHLCSLPKCPDNPNPVVTPGPCVGSGSDHLAAVLEQLDNKCNNIHELKDLCAADMDDGMTAEESENCRAMEILCECYNAFRDAANGWNDYYANGGTWEDAGAEPGGLAESIGALYDEGPSAGMGPDWGESVTNYPELDLPEQPAPGEDLVPPCPDCEDE